jgi:hypothetical protein
MDSWHATFLGRRHLPRQVTAFEIEVFFQFSAEEARIIEERRRPELKLGLALQIGFLRMSGRLLDAVRMVPPLLWRHLGARFGVAAPDLASLRAMYRRAPTLIEHQQIACDALGFQWLTGHHRRALVRVLRQELDRTDDRERLLGFARGWLYEDRLIIVHERLLRSMITFARRAHEAQLARRIDHAVEPGLMMRWRACSPTSSWPGTRLRCRKSSIIGRSVVVVRLRPSSSDSSHRPGTRVSTCAVYSASRSSTMLNKSYRLRLPRKRARGPREHAKQTWNSALHRGDQNTPQNQNTCMPNPRAAREIYLPATVCYCT